MHRLPEVCSVTEFRDNISEKIRKLRKSGRVTLLTHNGKAAAVVMSPEEFEAFDAEHERTEVVKIIEENRKDIDAGRGIPLDTFDRKMRAKLKTLGKKERGR